MVRTLSNQKKTWGVRARLRVMREAGGQTGNNTLVLTDNLYDTNLKFVTAEEVSVAISR